MLGGVTGADDDARAARRTVFGALVAALAVVGTVVAGPARADDVTVSVDHLRTGWDPNEPGLGPSAVSASDFGQLFSTTVNGQVYAQPIVVGGTVIVMTENNWIYGLNAATGVITWSRSVGPAWPASAIGCGDLVPNIGITSTPVYDPATNSVFFTSKVNDGPDADHPHFYLHAINPATGAERSGLAGDDPGLAEQRPDQHVQPQDGRPATRTAPARRRGLRRVRQPLRLRAVRRVRGRRPDHHADDDDPVVHRGAVGSNGMAGIWQSGGGLVSDGPGRIFVSTGNGVSPPPGPRAPARRAPWPSR